MFNADNTIEVYCQECNKHTRAVVDALYSKGGYVYVFEADRFVTYKGLGKLEVISFEAEQPVRRVRLSKTDIVALLQILGTRVVRSKGN